MPETTPYFLLGMGVVLSILGIYIVGLFARFRVARRMIAVFERSR
ncbi:MAG: hypothetical protein SNJ59_06285 [Aggregatilineales bacterium]